MRSFLHLLLAALSTIVTRVWDGVRWVCLTVTGTHPLPVDVTPAEAAADAVVEAHRAAVANDAPVAAPVRMPGWPAAVQAKEFLWAIHEGWTSTPSLDALSPEAQAWLHSLDEDTARTVRSDTHLADLQRHLTGERQTRSLPPVLAMDVIIAKAEEKRRSDQVVLDILQSLIDDDATALNAA